MRQPKAHIAKASKNNLMTTFGNPHIALGATSDRAGMAARGRVLVRR